MQAADIKPRTRVNYRSTLVQLQGMTREPLADLSLRGLERLLHAVREKYRAAPTYAHILRLYLRWAGHEDLAVKCRIKQRTKRIPPDSILTVEDVEALLAACHSLRDRAIVALLWETGQRISAVMALRLQDVVLLEPGRYRLWFHTVKIAGEEHQAWIVETAPILEAWLSAYPDSWKTEGAPLLPTSTGRGLPKNQVWQLLHRTAVRAGIRKRVHPHLFRHSRATHLLSLGMTEPHVKALLGWAPGSGMLRRYSHLVQGPETYSAYLRSLGHEVPPVKELRRLQLQDRHLSAVVPLRRPPGTKEDAMLDRLLEDPAFREALKAKLREVLP